MPGNPTLVLTKEAEAKKTTMANEAMSVKRPPFKRLLDQTETDSQAQEGIFKKRHKAGDGLRSRTTKTEEGFRSGYHESAVTDATFRYLSEATDNGDGTHTLAQRNSGSFAKYSSKRVSSSALNAVMEQADGFRTDTSRTILSAKEGKAAGHSGSSLRLYRQPEAHVLLVESVMEALTQNVQLHSGITERSTGVFFGALTVSSMAPAEVARTLEKGTSSLKSKQAIPVFEERRNESKKRVNLAASSLNLEESSFVRLNMEGYFKKISLSSSVQSSALESRSLASQDPTSPLRVPSIPSIKSEVQGGGYDNKTIPSLSLDPSVGQPETLKDYGAWMTQPFRGERVSRERSLMRS